MEKIYLGNGKKMKDNWRKSSLCLSDIPKEHIFEYNGKKYVKLNISDKEQVDQYGKDVAITLDTYKPEQKEENGDNDLPF
jgi:phosphodiesterase/alkaline phosphatase D-like protein